MKPLPFARVAYAIFAVWSCTSAAYAYEITVIDGDTIRVSGHEESTRLIGYDTPEVFRPQCAAELEAGAIATRWLRLLIGQATSVDLRWQDCACSRKTLNTSRCNFGRSCAVLLLDDKDVARLMIETGHARPYVCSRTRCPRRTNWCS